MRSDSRDGGPPKRRRSRRSVWVSTACPLSRSRCSPQRTGGRWFVLPAPLRWPPGARSGRRGRRRSPMTGTTRRPQWLPSPPDERSRRSGDPVGTVLPELRTGVELGRRPGLPAGSKCASGGEFHGAERHVEPVTRWSRCGSRPGPHPQEWRNSGCPRCPSRSPGRGTRHRRRRTSRHCREGPGVGEPDLQIWAVAGAEVFQAQDRWPSDNSRILAVPGVACSWSMNDPLRNVVGGWGTGDRCACRGRPGSASSTVWSSTSFPRLEGERRRHGSPGMTKIAGTSTRGRVHRRVRAGVTVGSWPCRS